MITASIVLYKTKETELKTIVNCALKSSISTVFIIDNSPTNELQTIINNCQSSKLVYIYGQGNIGYGAGHNIAIKKSIEVGATYHIILNPDIIFQPDAIASLTQFMELHPEVGSVMPNIIYPDGKCQKLCKLLPTPFDIFARRLFPSKGIKKRNKKFEMHFMDYDKIWNVPYLSGCFMFLRTSTLKQVGGFDEQYFMYSEDIDLTRRIHRISKTIFYPFVTVIHAHRAEHRTSKTLLKISIISTIKYFNKYGWFFDKERRLFNKRAQLDEARIIE